MRHGIALDMTQAALSIGIPSFVPAAMRANPPDAYLNLKTNQAWIKAGNQTVSADTLVTVSRASGATQVDSLGNWSQVGSNILARSDLGASIWESRTNSIRNDTMQGAVAGSPGTMPTNWQSNSSGDGLSRQIVGTGTENGIDYIDIRYSGTTSGTTGITIAGFDANTQIAATYGQTWTVSAFLKLVGGSLANVNTVYLRVAARNGAGSSLTNVDTNPAIGSGALGQSRYSTSGTLTNSATAFANGFVGFTYGNGVAIDFTIRIGWPQLENNNINSTLGSTGTITSSGSGGGGRNGGLSGQWWHWNGSDA